MPAMRSAETVDNRKDTHNDEARAHEDIANEEDEHDEAADDGER